MDQIRRTKRSEASPGERRRTSILDAAEDLFSREGPSAVTLRSIAAAADVNIAAVNYYFGSKEKLFEEMFLRRVVPLNDDRLARLQACVGQPDGKRTLKDVVTAYVMPALQLIDASRASARAIVVQYSLGRVLAIPEVNEMLVRYYARVREAFVAALQEALPHLAPHEVVWRYYWMGGSVMVALAVPAGIVEASDGEGASTEPDSCRSVAANLIAFLVHGLSAPGGSLAAASEGAGMPVGGTGSTGGAADMLFDLARRAAANAGQEPASC
jgi:AcrR family transcriptional regulator